MTNAETIESLKEKIKRFFYKKGVEEVSLGNRIKILNGTLNLNNTLKFEMGGKKYPLPQTSLFDLESDYINSQFGVFTFIDVYDYNEKGDPIQKIVCEFILKGDDKMINGVNLELINSIGFSIPITLNYEDILRKYSVNQITDDIKLRINHNLGNAVTIKNFPINENGNWFIKSENGEYMIRETILNGYSTIMYYQLIDNGEQLRDNFQTFNNSKLKEIMLDNFDSQTYYEELNQVCQLNLEERFLGRLDLTQLSKTV